MHISEGLLPLDWSFLWYLILMPFLLYGLHTIRKRSVTLPQYTAFIALVGALVFIISALPIPVPIAGTCSHPAGTGLGAVLIGPVATVVVSAIALFLQAIFLAHGGVSTLGANTVSMGIAGGLTGYLAFRVMVTSGAGTTAGAFAAGFVGDMAVYATTALQLALAFHGTASIPEAWAGLMILFLPTQAPLALLEGVLTVLVVRYVMDTRPDILLKLGLNPAARGEIG